ncbi:MAG: polysaccharide biosynthesis/export family protein [Gammaproteobacteria bacterium]
MIRSPARCKRWWAAFVLLAVAPFCVAQQRPTDDISTLMLGQQNGDAAAAARVRAAREAEAEQAAALAETPEPTDAASLLGTRYSPAENAMFGAQLFQPGMAKTYGQGFNEDYTLAIGDRVSLRMWGAFSYEDVQTVDPQGNLFLPNVGPIRVAGVRNRDLNDVVRAAIREVYRSNVDVYASLEASQPVRVFVTGYVRAPGQYAGVAADSVLDFLLRAGGVDPDRGSYIDIRLLRGGQVRASFNLYDFLIEGRLEQVQLQDGDTIVVAGRHNSARVTGEVFNAYGFEFTTPTISAAELLALARPRPGATHVSITHKTGTEQFGEYYAIDELDGVFLASGDEMAVVADRTVRTILVRVDGAVESSRVLTLPYGSRLADALERVTPMPEANMEAVQLFRESVRERQREMIEVSLRVLERLALTSRSTTSEEAALRAQEAEQIMRFIERARTVEPRGQIVLAGREKAMETLLEDGDVIHIPERSSLVMVHGEVTYPSAIAYDSRSRVSDYIELAGGTTQRKRDTRILLLRQDGTFVEDLRARPEPGDEILVLPSVGTRNIEVARGISEILFQLAVVARVALDL